MWLMPAQRNAQPEGSSPASEQRSRKPPCTLWQRPTPLTELVR